MSKRSRKKRFPREEPQGEATKPEVEKPSPPTGLRHEVREQGVHSGDVFIEETTPEMEAEAAGEKVEYHGYNLQMEVIKRREWMAANQFGLTPQEREKKWDEIRALEGKLRSRA